MDFWIFFGLLLDFLDFFLYFFGFFPLIFWIIFDFFFGFFGIFFQSYYGDSIIPRANTRHYGYWEIYLSKRAILKELNLNIPLLRMRLCK